jgi:murein DD-endopeptidase MepM/ murein hydrolase activator NlpD
MEMQNVIGEQYISRRHRRARIVPDNGFVQAPRNGPIEKKHKPSMFASLDTRRFWQVPHQKDAMRPSTSKSTKHKGASIRHALSEKCRYLIQSFRRTASSLRGLLITKRGKSTAGAAALQRKSSAVKRPFGIVPLLGILGTIAVSAGLFSISTSTPYAELHGFILPDDNTISSILLDSLTPEAPEIDETLAPPVLPLTLAMKSYKIAKNDTLDSIARRFGIRLDTLISVNAISDVRKIPAGYSLKIPNIDGIAHIVRKGESISGIASSAAVSVMDIVDANDLSSQTIQPGQSLFIPGARLSSYDLKKALGQLVIWPITGNISSYFGYRPSPFYGTKQFHSGIDIVGPENMPAKAAMDGRIAETGYSAIFGNYVIISHDGGYQSLYAHLNSIKAKRGLRILQGETVGLIGSTGYSTGVHLHFGVFKNGKAIDPMKLLKNR